jgi:hypothetical protein
MLSLGSKCNETRTIVWEFKMVKFAFVILIYTCDSVCGIPQEEAAINTSNNSDKLLSTHESVVLNVRHPDMSHHKSNHTRDENHPLLTVVDTRPHSMTLLIKTLDYKANTMIRLLYERVSANKGPFMLHLDDPVIEVIPLLRRVETHTLAELPMGKYIVCGEAMAMGEVYQASCFETKIERLDNNSKIVYPCIFFLC